MVVVSNSDAPMIHLDLEPPDSPSASWCTHEVSKDSRKHHHTVCFVYEHGIVEIFFSLSPGLGTKAKVANPRANKYKLGVMVKLNKVCKVRVVLLHRLSLPVPQTSSHPSILYNGNISPYSQHQHDTTV